MTGAVVQRMRECPVPVVAAVNGLAAGAGAVIALAADLRLVARSASFAFLFTKVGLAGADMGSAYLLPRLVGFGRATELLLLGDTVDAETAPAVRARDARRRRRPARGRGGDARRAARLGAGPRLREHEALLTRELDLDLGSAIELEAQTQAALLGSRDHREFHASFVEKREPRFEGR